VNPTWVKVSHTVALARVVWTAFHSVSMHHRPILVLQAYVPRNACACCENLERLEVILKLARELAHCAGAVENTSLTPMIQITSLNATRADAKRPPEWKRKARQDGPFIVRSSPGKRTPLPTQDSPTRLAHLTALKSLGAEPRES
jgi:hypothetical protein